MATVTSKKQFYKLWKGLKLGNRIQVFENIDEFLTSGWIGLTSIRYKEPGSPYKAFHIPAHKVLDKVAEFVAQGANKQLFTFNESAPDDCLLIQGEIQYIYELGHGLTLTYNTKKCAMKEAMEHPLTATGLRAKMIMEYYMNPKSFDMIRDLFELYPDDVIEFGVYGKNLGILPGHNTVIWEVRAF